MHAPSRTAKLAGVAALAGLMMTVAIVVAVRQSPPAPAPPSIAHGEERQDRLAREIDRCATLTMPDAGCEAVWAENRRRFFHQGEPAQGASAASPAEAPAP